jgi:hypothetical protein
MNTTERVEKFTEALIRCVWGLQGEGATFEDIFRIVKRGYEMRGGRITSEDLRGISKAFED